MKQYLVILLMMLSTLVASAQGRKTDSAITDKDYSGPALFSSFGRKAGMEERFPFKTDCKISLSGITVKSGKPLTTVPDPDALPGLSN